MADESKLKAQAMDAAKFLQQELHYGDVHPKWICDAMAAFARQVAADLRDRLADAEESLQLETERRESAERKSASLSNSLYESAQENK